MDRVLGALLTDEKCSDELRLAYYLLSKEVGQTEVIKLTVYANGIAMLFYRVIFVNNQMYFIFFRIEPRKVLLRISNRNCFHRKLDTKA